MEGIWRDLNRKPILPSNYSLAILTNPKLEIKLQNLEEQGFPYLPGTLPNPKSSSQSSNTTAPFDRAFELKRLTKSLLLNFLELTGTLATAPISAEAKVQDLRTIFINMHHVINEYRPHQARESVIELMGEHLDRTRRETRSLREVADKAARVLEGLGSLGIGEVSAGEEAKTSLEKEEEGEKKKKLLDEGAGLVMRGTGWREADGLLG